MSSYGYMPWGDGPWGYGDAWETFDDVPELVARALVIDGVYPPGVLNPGNTVVLRYDNVPVLVTQLAHTRYYSSTQTTIVVRDEVPVGLTDFAITIEDRPLGGDIARTEYRNMSAKSARWFERDYRVYPMPIAYTDTNVVYDATLPSTFADLGVSAGCCIKLNTLGAYDIGYGLGVWPILYVDGNYIHTAEILELFSYSRYSILWPVTAFSGR